jgi:3-hydroxy-9,10-secoandrosta-1,3,5(10)-triene-9,17-dione monooxygenase reductase component
MGPDSGPSAPTGDPALEATAPVLRTQSAGRVTEGDGMIDGDRFRKTMGHFVTGVAVATARTPDGGFVGLTCNSLASVSLDPPLVLFSVDHGSRSRLALLEAGAFAVSLLRREEEELSWRFAAEDAEERFENVPLRFEATGSPVLEGALAWLDCTLWKTVEAGDHTVFFGHVEAAGFADGGDPLVFFRGRYGTVVP